MQDSFQFFKYIHHAVSYLQAFYTMYFLPCLLLCLVNTSSSFIVTTMSCVLCSFSWSPQAEVIIASLEPGLHPVHIFCFIKMISLHTCLFWFVGFNGNQGPLCVGGGGCTRVCVCMGVCVQMSVLFPKSQAPTNEWLCELGKSLIYYCLYKILVTIFTYLTRVS